MEIFYIHRGVDMHQKKNNKKKPVFRKTFYGVNYQDSHILFTCDNIEKYSTLEDIVENSVRDNNEIYISGYDLNLSCFQLIFDLMYIQDGIDIDELDEDALYEFEISSRRPGVPLYLIKNHDLVTTDKNVQGVFNRAFNTDIIMHEDYSKNINCAVFCSPAYRRLFGKIILDKIFFRYKERWVWED